MDKWMNEWKDEWINEWMSGLLVNEQMDKQMNWWVGEWINKWNNKWRSGWMGEWMMVVMVGWEYVGSEWVAFVIDLYGGTVGHRGVGEHLLLVFDGEMFHQFWEEPRDVPSIQDPCLLLFLCVVLDLTEKCSGCQRSTLAGISIAALTHLWGRGWRHL